MVVVCQVVILDWLLNGWVLFNLVIGSDFVELVGDGVFFDYIECYEVLVEFIYIWCKLMEGEIVIFNGKYQCVCDVKLLFLLLQQLCLLFYFGGLFEVVQELVVEQVDFYFIWGELLVQVVEKIVQV